MSLQSRKKRDWIFAIEKERGRNNEEENTSSTKNKEFIRRILKKPIRDEMFLVCR